MHTKYEPVPVLARTSTVAYRLPRLLSCSPGVLIRLRIVIPWLSLEELPGSTSWALGCIRQGTPNFFQGHSSHPRLARDFSCAVRFSVLGIWTAHMYFLPVHKAMDFILACIHIYCILLITHSALLFPVSLLLSLYLILHRLLSRHIPPTNLHCHKPPHTRTLCRWEKLWEMFLSLPYFAWHDGLQFYTFSFISSFFMAEQKSNLACLPHPPRPFICWCPVRLVPCLVLHRHLWGVLIWLPLGYLCKSDLAGSSSISIFILWRASIPIRIWILSSMRWRLKRRRSYFFPLAAPGATINPCFQANFSMSSSALHWMRF